MKLKRTALLSLGAFIGFTLFYIGLNEWQHKKESTGKINIVTTGPTPNQAQTPTNTQPTSPNQTLQNQPPNAQNQATTPQTTTAQNSSPSTTPQTTTPQANNQQSKPTAQKPASPKTITQIIKNAQEKTSAKPPTNYQKENLVFQIGAFKSQTALQRAIDKTKALGFEPIVTQQKGFYIVKVKLESSQEGLKLLTAFPGAFRVR